jgi:hypothetical protein
MQNHHAQLTSGTTRKRHAYDRDMLREDFPDRFDYLYEPLEVDETPAAPELTAQPADDSRWSRRIVLTGVVLATLAAAAATAAVMLQPAAPSQDLVVPADATPLSASTAPSTSMVAPAVTEPDVPVAPATVSTPAPRTAAETAATPEPLPVQPPTTIATEPSAVDPPPPATRAPMSVSPSSRAPFPDQTPPRKNDEGHGLLGGHGLL